MNNASGTKISNVSANGDGRGVELDGSSHVTLDQLSLNKMTGNALRIDGSSYVALSNSKLKATADGQVPHNADGLYVLNSHDLSIGGVLACPRSQVCNTFDYDTGWGVYLQNTQHVMIDRASANADDTGACILDNASYVDLGNSSAGAGGPICITPERAEDVHRLLHRHAGRAHAHQWIARQHDPLTISSQTMSGSASAAAATGSSRTLARTAGSRSAPWNRPWGRTRPSSTFATAATTSGCYRTRASDPRLAPEGVRMLTGLDSRADLGQPLALSPSELVSRRALLATFGSAGLALTGLGCGSGHQHTTTHTVRQSAPPTNGPGPPVPGTLEQAIRGQVFRPGQPGFSTAAHVYDPRFDHVLPTAVARPVYAVDVQNAIRFTVAHNVPARARSGGHSYAGYSTLSDGVVLDLRKLNAIKVDKLAGTATVGAGAQLIDVYAGLAKAGATLPAGSRPSVGVSGVTLGGGFGLAARHFGLTADSLIAASIVTADGQLRAVTRRTDDDLLWALKGGGGGNFGVVTEFTFRVYPLPASAAYFNVSWPWSSAGEAIAAWQAWAPETTDKLTSILHLNSGSAPSITANGQYLGPSAALPGLLRPLLAVPGANLTSQLDMPYLRLQLLLAGCSGQSVAACHTVGAAPGGTLPRNTFNAKSDYVNRPLSIAGRAAMIAAVEAPGSGSLLCDAYGGAVNRIAPTATAFAHRQQLFCIQYYGNGSTASWINQAWTKMRPYVSGQAYQNYIDPSLKDWRQAYYSQNLVRLETTRKRVDPHHYFNFPQAIGT